MAIQTADLDRQNTIASAAFEVFAEHGFRGTSMQMIACRAGMSRPALYLHFQNKEDVFRHLIAGFFDVAAQMADTALRPGKPADQALADLFAAFNPSGVLRMLFDAEHGAELFEAKGNIGADLLIAGEARIAELLSTWLKAEADAGRLDCPDPDMAAQTILGAHAGLKTPGIDFQTYMSRAQALARMLGRGLLGVK